MTPPPDARPPARAPARSAGSVARPAPPRLQATGLVVPTLVRMSLRSTLRSRRMAVAGLVCLIPALLGVALVMADASAAESARRQGREDFDTNLADPLAHLVLGGTIPLIAMLMAGSIVADDVEDRTFSYVLTRPLRRHQVYLSRLLPALAITVALALLQVLLFGATRLLSWGLHGRGTHETFIAADGTRHTYTALEVLLAQGGMGLLAAALAGAAFLALFGFVTVLTTRYHFLANVLTFASVELLFGNLGGQGAGVVTITYHVRSLLMVLGPGSAYDPAAWWVAVPVLLGMVALWSWLASWQMGRRDFNVTSAAS